MPEGHIKPHELPWSTPWYFNRCRARKHTPGDRSGFFGRCDLKRNHVGVPHCLERGFDYVFWFDKEVLYLYGGMGVME